MANSANAISAIISMNFLDKNKEQCAKNKNKKNKENSENIRKYEQKQRK